MKSEGMFRIECLVDADKLGKVLWLLAGQVRELKQYPIINTRKTRGNGVTMMSSGDLVELFADWMRKRKLTEVGAKDAREFLVSLGRSEMSYGYVLNKARNAHLLKNIGKGPGNSRWRVLAAAKKKPAKASAKPQATSKG